MPRKIIARFPLGWLAVCCLFAASAPPARADDLPPQKYYLIDGTVTAQRLDGLESRVAGLEKQLKTAAKPACTFCTDCQCAAGDCPAKCPVSAPTTVPFPRPDNSAPRFISTPGAVTVCESGVCRVVRSGPTQTSEPKPALTPNPTTVNSSRPGLFGRLRENRADRSPIFGGRLRGGCSACGS